MTGCSFNSELEKHIRKFGVTKLNWGVFAEMILGESSMVVIFQMKPWNLVGTVGNKMVELCKGGEGEYNEMEKKEATKKQTVRKINILKNFPLNLMENKN